ncbi:hypothetical protein RLW55_16945 [Hyphomicrobium sp. B1]|uniref:hypothetical protein n=1 Tax=Hyphomicrobium sp. B1 TaxID=3075651 RepID=UPI003C2BE763
MADAEIRTIDLPAAVAALEKHLGFRSERTRQLARRLQETGMLPAGSHGVSARLDVHDFGTLALACAAGGTIAECPERVATLDRLLPGGIDASDFPEGVRKRMVPAGVDLDAMLRMAAEGDDCLRQVRIEVVSSWPEYAVIWQASGEVRRWREPGSLPGHWAAGHRRSTMIDGKALFYAVQALFADEAADAA